MHANSIFSGLFETLPHYTVILFLVLGWLLAVVLQIVFKINQKLADDAQQSSWFWWLSILWFLAALFLVNLSPIQLAPNYGVNHLVFDSKSILAQNLILLASIVGLVHIRLNQYQFSTFFYILWWFVVIASILLCHAVHFLSAYLFIESISIASYFIVALPFTKKSSEAAIKYAIFGSISSALMLYGISLFYGFSGNLFFNKVDEIYSLYQNTPLNNIACFLILGGALFKLSAFPYHLWVADMYEATPIPVVSLLSVVPKIAVFMLIIRQFGIYSETVFTIVLLLGMASILIGNFSALVQNNTKRLMAFSTIAQIGFMLLLVQNEKNMEPLLLFYLVSYVPANMLLFYIIDSKTIANSTVSLTNLDDFAGLGQKNVLFGIGLMIACLSLIGIPPTAGFSAKLLLFGSYLNQYNVSGSSLQALVLGFALLNTVIALAYYIKLPYFAFFKEGNIPKNNFLTIEKSVFVIVLCVIVLFIFFKSNVLLDYLNAIL